VFLLEFLNWRKRSVFADTDSVRDDADGCASVIEIRNTGLRMPISVIDPELRILATHLRSYLADSTAYRQFA
jgi:hypothetical protein